VCRKDRQTDAVIDDPRLRARVESTFVVYAPLAKRCRARHVLVQIAAVATEEKGKLQQPLRP
jgi:hypothetical protein